MDIASLREPRRRLDGYLSRFGGCCKTRPGRRHFRAYVRGQVSDLERKNVERIALREGVAPRTLQEYLEVGVWDEAKTRRRVRRIIARDHADGNAVFVIDETGNPKKGEKTCGVARQYCGATGKVDNCVVTVNLVYAAGDFHALADCDLYLPQRAWAQDRDRCLKAGIPQEVGYRPKHEIAVELLWRSMAEGLCAKWLTADEGYGRCWAFRRDVEDLGLLYVVEVPSDLAGWTEEALAGAPGEAPPPRAVRNLWPRGGPRWRRYHVKDTEKGPAVWEVRAARLRPREGGVPGRACWLLVARNVLDGEVKYFLSNAPPDTPVEVMLYVGFSRWHVERVFQDAKGEVGMDHFEVRTYRALTRHLALTMVSLLFLMKEAERLRGEKSVVESGAGSGGGRGAVGPETDAA